MSRFDAAMAAFRVRCPVQLQADLDAQLERMLGPLDDLQRDADAVYAGMYTGGVLPDRRAVRREPQP